VEVLSPAGSMDALRAALLAGADAVYLGGKRFGARRFASNFSDEDLKGAVRKAHDQSTKVYVTVNTLVKESELSEMASYLDVLQGIEVDAIIVQDRGVLHLARERFQMNVHASTQMGIHTPEGARWALENGIDRVILARELSLDEIRGIGSASEVGLEVFVHGALCYSFSGQCLFSSMVGGRSGNRGLCAQPCRKRYQLGSRSGFLLSTADILCADAIPELLRMGVEAVKIEGRMRSPLYVYHATRMYKNAIARALAGEKELVSEREKELVSVAFNRGFSGGYLLGGTLVQPEFPESRGLPLGKGMIRSGTLQLESPYQGPGDGLTMYRGSVKVGGFEIGPKGQMRVPFPIEEGEYSVFKTKDRSFPDLERRIGELGIQPIRVKRREIDLALPRTERTFKRAELSLYVSSLKVLEMVLPFADRIYYEWAPRTDEAKVMCDKANVEFVQMLPRVSPIIPECGFENIMCASVDQAARYAERRLFGHYSMNVLNSLSLPHLHQTTASVELSREDLRAMLQHFLGRVEVIVFGRLELMVTREPSLREGALVDERGVRFPTYRDAMDMGHVLNSSDLFLLEFLEELEEMGVDSFGIDLRKKSGDLALMVAKAFRERDLKKKSAIKRKCGAITTGHYLRGVE